MPGQPIQPVAPTPPGARPTSPPTVRGRPSNLPSASVTADGKPVARDHEIDVSCGLPLPARSFVEVGRTYVLANPSKAMSQRARHHRQLLVQRAHLRNGSVEWLCWPRPDSSFVFGPLLDRERGGEFVVEGVDADRRPPGVRREHERPADGLRGRRRRRSSCSTSRRASCSTTAPSSRRCSSGSCARSPATLASGCAAGRSYEYGRAEVGFWRASNHIEYTGFPTPVRLTTNVPLSYVEDERPFLLEQDRHLVLTWGEPLEAGLEETAERFLERTLDYWRQWVKGTRVPRDYQREVIRSALVLKLHQYEDTGALLAATTTSLPEHPGSGRTWDYRYCWLRDAYFTLNALERLGHSGRDGALPRLPPQPRARSATASSSPCTRSPATRRRPRRELDHLAGFDGDGPVRIGNQAFEHVQNDVYGEMMLARQPAPPRRAVRRRDPALARPSSWCERLARPDRRAARGARCGPVGVPRRTRLHSFSVLMHWAGARRAVEVAEALGADGARRQGRGDRATRRGAARGALLERRDRRADPGRRRAAARRRAPARRPASASSRPTTRARRRHVDAIRGALAVDGGLLRRYSARRTTSASREAAFTVCSFWLVEALAILGRDGRGATRSSSACSRSTTASASTARTSFRTRSSRAATSRRRTATSG